MMPTGDVSGEKERLRKELLEMRLQVDPDLVDMAARAVWRTLEESPFYRQAACVAAWASFKGEIDSLPILEGVLRDGKRLCLPRISHDRSHIGFHELGDLGELEPGTFGIPEPPPGRIVSVEELDLVLVPGLAFDREGFRLGFGGGYYDRVITRLRKDVLAVGSCYSFQVLDRLPRAPHDVPVHGLLTEKVYSSCRKDL